MTLKKSIIIVVSMILTSLSGLGAEPSKPDFAFPKTVSATAESDLKAALKSKNGPDIVDALIRYSLAQTAINPDDTEKIVNRLKKVESQVNDSVTVAMIQLLRAGIEHDFSLSFSVWENYGRVLRAVPVTDWKKVVVAEPQFFPTLYDFAAAKASGKDVADAMIEYYKDRPLPRLYWYLCRQQTESDSFERMLVDYDDIKSEPESAYLLARLTREAYSFKRRKQVYPLVRQWIAAHGSSPFRADVDKLESSLCVPSMSIDAQSVIGLGRTLRVSVHVECLNSCSVSVKQTKGLGAASFRRQLKFEGEGVFEADTVLELSFDNYGVYSLTPVFTGQSERRYRDFIEVMVSDILLWQANYAEKSDTYALDVINGAPQKDVKFATNRNMISATRGNDRFTPSIYKGYYEKPSDKTEYFANVLTDRGIYHPGDEVKFVAVVMAMDRKHSAPAPGRDVEAVLFNANYQSVDTLKLKSDDYGRVTGQFTLPSDGLTGDYSIRIDRLGSAYFTVTDYKAPTFEVKTECDRLSDTSVKVTGTAIGYNGFPIADANVTLEARTLPRWVWWRDFRNAGGKSVANDTVRTDVDGKFTAILEIPSDESLSVTATVASPTGETQQDEAFVPAMPYYISARIPRFFNPGKAPQIQVLNSRGEEERIPLIIKLTSLADSTVVVTPDATWENVPSGAYRVWIRTEEPAFAMPYELESFYVYRPSDKMPPAEMSLFVPVSRIESGERLQVGTSYTDSNILKTLWDGDKIISQEWLTPKIGNMLLDVSLPDGVESATLSLATLRNYQTEVIDVKVERKNIRRSLNLKFSSFRDRMVPGERERWSISVTDNLGSAAPAAVMLDVYSKALDAISPFDWSFHVRRPRGFDWRMHYINAYSRSASAYKNYDVGNILTITSPAFNLYGRSWPGRVFYSVTNCVMKSASSRMMMKMSDVDDCCDAVEEEVAFAAADAGAGAVSTDMALNESAVVRDEEGIEGDSNESMPVDEFRLPEVPVALWAPVLTTAPDGTLQVEFEAPNANTTWKLMCQAYDMDLLTGYHTAEIVAAKPVMVQPNVPRFLRVGDRTELQALIMNATDSAASVRSFIEIFDPLTAEVFTRKDFESELQAGKSETISLPLVAPDRSMLGIRVKATSGNFTDGEQSVIAILPAVITARSATPLFFAADSASVSVDVPKGSVVQLTTNAAWECVTALPGLAASESKSAFASSSALFSAAVARGLVSTYPQIASALKRWENADSVLVSKLSRNEDLKIALLSSTPWPAAAQSDSERMSRLLLLLDAKESQTVIDNAVNNLAKLVRKGGIAWTLDSEEPSQWVTEQFLSVVARLRQLGYLPSSAKLQRIISDAVKYLDSEVARDYAKYKGEYPTYAELRPMFPEVMQSAPAKRAQAATVQYLIAHWRELGFMSQAQAALILNANGYHKTACSIIESLRQYEAWRQTGLNAELLDAFAAVEPKCAEVDEIRQFFIERKQAMEWGDGLATSNLIASILSSGTNWLVPAENEMSLLVNGEAVSPGVESVMGSFRLELPEGGNVELHKGQFPAWGGIFTSLTDTVTEIPAFESEKLSITRRIEGDLSVGSRVKVIIEIDATQPLDYVVVKSPRAAGLSVVDQLPARMWLIGSSVYREPCATETNWFFSRLAKGKTILTEEFFVTSGGTFLFAPAEIQSQYAPEFHSRTEGSPLDL